MKHRMCHLPKDPFCEICRRAKMYKSKTARVRYVPLEARGHLESVTIELRLILLLYPGQVIA